MAPEFPAPSIVDYRPKSTLVSQTHLVPKAKFPAIDFHGHPGQLLGSADGLSSLVIVARFSLNVRLMVSADNMSGDRLAARDGGHQEQSLQGSRARAGGHQLHGRRTWLGRKGGRSSSKPTSRRAQSASARSAKGSACAHARRTDRG